MRHLFANIFAQLPDEKVTTFIDFMQTRQFFSVAEYLLFKKNLQKPFLNSLKYLASPDTIELDWYQPETKMGTVRIVAQTIDGDYIAADDEKTYVIPVSLDKLDTEIFEEPVSLFFKDYEQGQITSHILAAI